MGTFGCLDIRLVGDNLNDVSKVAGKDDRAWHLSYKNCP